MDKRDLIDNITNIAENLGDKFTGFIDGIKERKNNEDEPSFKEKISNIKEQDSSELLENIKAGARRTLSNIGESLENIGENLQDKFKD